MCGEGNCSPSGSDSDSSSGVFHYFVDSTFSAHDGTAGGERCLCFAENEFTDLMFSDDWSLDVYS